MPAITILRDFQVSVSTLNAFQVAKGLGETGGIACGKHSRYSMWKFMMSIGDPIRPRWPKWSQLILSADVGTDHCTDKDFLGDFPGVFSGQNDPGL